MPKSKEPATGDVQRFGLQICTPGTSDDWELLLGQVAGRLVWIVVEARVRGVEVRNKTSAFYTNAKHVRTNTETKTSQIALGNQCDMDNK